MSSDFHEGLGLRTVWVNLGLVTEGFVVVVVVVVFIVVVVVCLFFCALFVFCFLLGFFFLE